MLQNFAQAFYVSEVVAAGEGNRTQTARDSTTEQIVESKVEVTMLGPGMPDKNHPYLPLYLADINSLGEGRTRAEEKAAQTGQTQEAFRKPRGTDEHQRTLNPTKRWPPPKQSRAQDDLGP